MPVSESDQSLYQIVCAPPAMTIKDVIDRMIGVDRCLGSNDGLRWFNQLYLMVTRQIDLQPASTWKDAEWLLALDVVFAGFYFRAIAGFLNGDGTVPSSWMALFQSRSRKGVDRIQFAVAGMNAHINHDLCLALLEMETRTGVVPSETSAQHSDYEAVNVLLNSVIPGALQMLASDCLGMLAEDTGKVGRLLAFWDICKARDLAWKFADHLRVLGSGAIRQVAIDAQDQLTGVVGRSILVAT